MRKEYHEPRLTTIGDVEFKPIEHKVSQRAQLSNNKELYRRIISSEIRKIIDHLLAQKIPTPNYLVKQKDKILEDGKETELIFFGGGATLKDFLSDNVSEKDYFEFLDQLIKTVSSMHRAGVIHGDLDTKNIVVDPEKRQAQIIDFDAARFIDLDKMSPELLATEIFKDLEFLLIQLLAVPILKKDAPAFILEKIKNAYNFLPEIQEELTKKVQATIDRFVSK